MHTAAEYRSEAAEYILRAQGVDTSARRLKLLEMAQSCLRLADQAELLAESAQQTECQPRSDIPQDRS
jgi:hypothetical protein